MFVPTFLLMLSSAVQAPEKPPALLVGDPAPAFAVERFLRGTPRERLETGRVHIVEFWAVWCGPCIAGMPHLTALQRDLGPRGLDVIGVAPRPDEWGHDRASIDALLERKGDAIGYAIALDAESDTEGYQGVFRGRTIESWMGAARVGAIPIAFVVDREGRIAAIAPPLEIDAVVRACLDGTFDREAAAARYRALLEARDLFAELEQHLEKGERDLAFALSEELLAGPLWNDARYLGAIAGSWSEVGDDGQALELALRAARRADELSGSQDPGTLGLLARLARKTGAEVEAQRAQERALALAEGPLRDAIEREFAAVAPRAAALPAPSAGDDLSGALDELVRVYADAGELSGVVLVARGSEILLRKAYGLADAARGVANTCDTRFHVASLTKTFTSAAVLLLVREGKLALSDPIARFLPDYPRGGEITVEHLLGHGSGLPDHHGLPGFAERTASHVSARDMVEFVRPFPLDFAPGTQSRYSNSGYAMLAYLVEIVSGRPFADFVRERLLEPLGLQHTGEAPTTATAPERALGHDPGRAPTWLEPVLPRDYSYAVGSGSLESTADDLLAWARAIDSGSVVDLLGQPYPYGWGKRERFGRRRIEQTGMHSGFTSVLAIWPDDDLYVVHLSNVIAGSAWRELHLGLAAIVLGEDLEWPEREPIVSLERAALERLAGSYHHPNGFDFTIELAADGPRLGGPEKRARVLDALAPDRLRYRFEGAELRFAPGERPASVEWVSGSDRWTCPRAAR